VVRNRFLDESIFAVDVGDHKVTTDSAEPRLLLTLCLQNSYVARLT